MGGMFWTNSDVITTATAQKGNQKILEASWIKEGLHINKIGGDSPGKTELDPELIPKCKIVVELLEQTKIEGEIQQVNAKIYAALWELAAGKKKGRESDKEITLFDSVGFALEDYSVLRLVHELAEEHDIGCQLTMIPDISDPKNLFGGPCINFRGSPYIRGTNLQVGYLSVRPDVPLLNEQQFPETVRGFSPG